jgi:GT2 family glycosyltransferase
MSKSESPYSADSLNDLTVVLVTFNSAHCLAPLGKTLAGFPHIVVVDNNSDDGTAGQVRLHLPQARIIQNTKNLGFGAANNQALKQIQTPFGLLLNPDCELTADSALRLMATAQAFPTAALVAPQLLKSNGQPDINYRWVNTLWTSKGPGTDGLCSVGFACGAAWLLNMSHMQIIGFFDERFFLYYEDDDLCHRIFDSRHEILIDPSVKLTHSSRGSVRGKHPLRSEYIRGYHHAQSKIIYTRKYKNKHAASVLKLLVLLGALASVPLRLLAFSPKHIARLAGRIAGLLRI